MKNIVKKIFWYYNYLRLKKIGEKTFIHPFTTISGNLRNLSISENCIISSGCVISCEGINSFITIGNNTIISQYVMLMSYGGFIEIGDFCNISPFAILYGHAGLKIGNNVLIAAHTVLVPSNHIFTDKNQLIRCQGDTKKGIIIEDDVWIGAGCKILDGVTIGKGSVIGANAVITKNVEPYSVVVGVPGKVIKYRGQ